MATIIGSTNNLKFVYLHIPKTGGSSISSWIEKAFNADIAIEKKFIRHELLSTVQNEIAVENYYTFTCVRNPWARTLSGYLNLKRHYDHNRKDMMKHLLEDVLCLHKSFPEFNDFIDSLPYIDSMIGDDWNQKTNQVDWCNPGADYIMKLENIEQDFHHVQKLFNNFKPLNVFNKSSVQLDYKNVFNDKSKNIVSKLFERDVDTFKYTF